jgi:hypothetical protein
MLIIVVTVQAFTYSPSDKLAGAGCEPFIETADGEMSISDSRPTTTYNDIYYNCPDGNTYKHENIDNKTALAQELQRNE